MQAIFVLFLLACLVSLAGYIWLLKVAFSRSALWGVLVFFFSPIAAAIYAVKFWDESKKPFLVYSGSIAGCFLLGIASVLLVGSGAVDAMEQEMAQVEIKHEAPAVAEVGEFKERPSSSLAVAGAEAKREERVNSLADTLATLIQPQNEPKATRRRSQFISVDDIDSFQGKKFEVLTRDGYSYKGRYVTTTAGKLEFRRTVYAGDMALHLKPAQIKSLRLADAPRH
jgi:hypothetical protein